MTKTSAKLPKVAVSVFPGGFNWGIYVGQDKGFFEEQGIAVDIYDTPNSIRQMTDFANGDFEIAMTAFDNIVAYCEGQGEAPIGRQPNFFAFMGSDSGFLNLIAASEIQTISDLAGRVVSVDAFTTGYAFVLYEILRRSGLNKNAGDYKVVSAGGTVQRWKALSERLQDATLLSTPYNIMAAEAGFNNLGKAVDIVGAYQGNVAAARKSWAELNSQHVVAFIRAYRNSITWLYEPSNRVQAIGVLRGRLSNFSSDAAEVAYRELLDPRHGFFKGCKIDVAGVLAPVWGKVSSELKSSVTNGAIVAFRVEEHDGNPVLTPTWVSRDMDSPEPPVITSGIVFALSAGRYASDERPIGHATLYALDATTGKELYSTGNQVTTPGNLTGMTLVNGRVFFTTNDSTMYGFGIFLER